VLGTSSFQTGTAGRSASPVSTKASKWSRNMRRGAALFLQGSAHYRGCGGAPATSMRACAALDSASVLSDVPRQHLQHGLRHLGEHEVLNAWPPLIIGLEGAFTDVAIAQGIAVRVGNHVHLTDANGKALTKKLPSVEGVAALLGHDDNDDFGDFLVRQVYGGEGNPFRHGSAKDGIRDRAICLAVAVIGWLDAFVAPGSLDLLDRAVMEELAKRDEAAGEPEDVTDEPEASTN
jgi:hypothetical protein